MRSCSHLNTFPPLITVGNMFPLVITVGNRFPLVITIVNMFPLLITVAKNNGLSFFKKTRGIWKCHLWATVDYGVWGIKLLCNR